MVLYDILRHKLIAVVRASDPSALLPAAEALARGGIKAIEFPYADEAVLEVLPDVRQALPDDVALGAGTVLSADAAQACIQAGAEFIVSPTFKESTQAACEEAGVPAIPGAATPTEIQRAWEGGATLVKVFPAAVVGPRFFSDVIAPFPQIQLAAFGGVALANVQEYLRAGAAVIGVASGLVGRDLNPKSDWSLITERARAYDAEVLTLSSDRA